MQGYEWLKDLPDVVVVAFIIWQIIKEVKNGKSGNAPEVIVEQSPPNSDEYRELVKEMIQSNANAALAQERLATAINTQTKFFEQREQTYMERMEHVLTEVQGTRLDLKKHHEKTLELCISCRKGA